MRMSLLSLITRQQVVKPVRLSIGILICALLVNVCSCRETQVEFETAKGLPWVAFHGYFMQLLQQEEHGRSRFIYIIGYSFHSHTVCANIYIYSMYSHVQGPVTSKVRIKTLPGRMAKLLP